MALYGNSFNPDINTDSLLKLYTESASIESKLYNQIIENNGILNEGFFGNLFAPLINGIKNIIKNTKRSMMKLNNAKISKQMNDDLFTVLKILQMRTEKGTQYLGAFYLKLLDDNYSPANTYFKDEMINRNTSIEAEQWDTDLNHEINKSYIDATENIKAVKASREYKRIQENKYDDKNLETIPLKYIMKDIEYCESDLNQFNDQLDKINKVNTTKFTNADKKLYSDMIMYLRLMIYIVSLRMSILNKFLDNAEIKIMNFFKSRDVDSKYAPWDYINRNEWLIADVTEAIYGKGEGSLTKLNNLLTMLTNFNKTKEFKKYMSTHAVLLNMLGLPKKSTIMSLFGEEGKNVRTYYARFIINDYDSIQVANRPLYHMSEIHNLKQINPTCIGNWGKTYYPEPRVYAHINVPLDKMGKKIGSVYEKNYVYRVLDAPKVVYRDPALAATAIFFSTEKPVKVKEFNIDDYLKQNSIQ